MFLGLAAAARRGFGPRSCWLGGDRSAIRGHPGSHGSMAGTEAYLLNAVQSIHYHQGPNLYKHAECKLHFSKICPICQLKTRFIREPIRRCLCFYKHIVSIVLPSRHWIYVSGCQGLFLFFNNLLLLVQKSFRVCFSK